MLGTVACMVVRGSWSLSMSLELYVVGACLCRTSHTLSTSYLTDPLRLTSHRLSTSYLTDPLRPAACAPLHLYCNSAVHQGSGRGNMAAVVRRVVVHVLCLPYAQLDTLLFSFLSLCKYACKFVYFINMNMYMLARRPAVGVVTARLR